MRRSAPRGARSSAWEPRTPRQRLRRVRLAARRQRGNDHQRGDVERIRARRVGSGQFVDRSRGRSRRGESGSGCGVLELHAQARCHGFPRPKRQRHDSPRGSRPDLAGIPSSAGGLPEALPQGRSADTRATGAAAAGTARLFQMHARPRDHGLPRPDQQRTLPTQWRTGQRPHPEQPSIRESPEPLRPETRLYREENRPNPLNTWAADGGLLWPSARPRRGGRGTSRCRS